MSFFSFQVARINHTTAAALAQAAATHQLTDAHRATELARLAAAVERADGRWEGFVAQGWPEMRERLAAHGKVVGGVGGVGAVGFSMGISVDRGRVVRIVGDTFGFDGCAVMYFWLCAFFFFLFFSSPHPSARNHPLSLQAVELLEGERFGLIGPQLIGQLANTTNDKVAAVRGEVALLQLSLAAMREDVLKQALAASQALVAKQEDRLLALEGEVRLLVAELRKK